MVTSGHIQSQTGQLAVRFLLGQANGDALGLMQQLGINTVRLRPKSGKVRVIP
ncbi:MAG: hypothetical protein RMZ69_33520 [Nostoc sp. ChiQUE01a]|nr:hypothetical protein [Nostoc sp. ChiQUE01a]